MANKQPSPWSFRPDPDRVSEIEASMSRLNLKRNAWLRFVVGAFLDWQADNYYRTRSKHPQR